MPPYGRQTPGAGAPAAASGFRRLNPSFLFLSCPRGAQHLLLLSQDLCPVMVAPRFSSAAAQIVAVPLLPQRFNGPCGLLAAVQAEMLLVASTAADEASGNILNAAVERMLLRAARANADTDAVGRGQFRSVTRLLCHACCSPLSVSAPIEEDSSYEEDELEGAVASAHACACGCPPLLRLSWSGSLWCTLEVLCCFCICVCFSLVILHQSPALGRTASHSHTRPASIFSRHSI